MLLWVPKKPFQPAQWGLFHKSRTVTCLFFLPFPQPVDDVLGKAGHWSFSWGKKTWGALVEIHRDNGEGQGVKVTETRLLVLLITRAQILVSVFPFSFIPVPFKRCGKPELIWRGLVVWRTVTVWAPWGRLLLLWALSLPCLCWCAEMAGDAVTACPHRKVQCWMWQCPTHTGGLQTKINKEWRW